MKLTFAFVIVVLLFITEVNAKLATEVFDTVSKSVVVVLNYDDKRELTSFGSGVIIPNGSIVTNYHVVEGSEHVFIRFENLEYNAFVEDIDKKRDLCTLKSAALGAVPVTFGNSQKQKIGSKVYAVGTPQGFELTMSEGIVSGQRKIEGRRYIQTTAPISPGSSGGGLFDEDGNLVGLTSFTLTEGQNINFALPVEWIIELPKRIEALKKISDEWCPMVRKTDIFEDDEDANRSIIHALNWTHASPDNSLAWFSLGLAYGRSNGRDFQSKAIEAYETALLIEPDDERTLNNLGIELAHCGEIDRAIQLYMQALKLNPESLRVLNNLAVAYGYSGQPKKAIKIFTNLLSYLSRQTSSITDVLFKETIFENFGVVSLADREKFVKQSNYADEYFVKYKDLLEKYNEEPVYQSEILYVFSHKAIPYYENMANSHPGDIANWNILLFLYTHHSQWTDAFEACQQIFRLNPNDSRALYILAIYHKREKQPAKIMDTYKRLQSVDPIMASLLSDKLKLN